MRDKIIWVSGGTGSFGSNFIRDILTKEPKQIRVFSRDELKQAQLKSELNDSRVSFHLGDVRDYERLLTSLNGVDIVIHAAALKRIEFGETNPYEFIKTNIQGSINVANACLKNNVKKAILISTDKAVYAINLYGATKLVAEKVWIQSNVYRSPTTDTRFSVVRYGNVLGSRGSVLHLFKDQLSKGVLKVTDERMTRFFITLQEAVDLVQMGLEFMQGGEIFIPDLRAASIYHLATLCAGGVPVEITSQRGGEKLHEQLITKEESTRLVSYEHYSVINPEFTTWPYAPWRSELRRYYASSEEAPKFTNEDLRHLIESI